MNLSYSLFCTPLSLLWKLCCVVQSPCLFLGQDYTSLSIVSPKGCPDTPTNSNHIRPILTTPDQF